MKRFKLNTYYLVNYGTGNKFIEYIITKNTDDNYNLFGVYIKNNNEYVYKGFISKESLIDYRELTEIEKIICYSKQIESIERKLNEN